MAANQRMSSNASRGHHLAHRLWREFKDQRGLVRRAWWLMRLFAALVGLLDLNSTSPTFGIAALGDGGAAGRRAIEKVRDMNRNSHAGQVSEGMTEKAEHRE